MDGMQEIFTKCKILCRTQLVNLMEKKFSGLQIKKRLNTSNDNTGIIISQQDEHKDELGKYICTVKDELEKMQLIAKTKSRTDSLDDMNKEIDKIDEGFKPAVLQHHKVKKSFSKKKQGIHKEKQRWNQKLVVILLMAYIGLQAFLPYSHFITKVR